MYADGVVDAVFACLIGPGALGRHALLFARSLRAFGGRWADSPVMVLVRDGVALDSELTTELQACGVRIVPHLLSDVLSVVPLAERAAGAAQAEAHTEGSARLLVWLDSDSLVMREPLGLRIPPDAQIGCRPVDLRLIGSAWNEEPDAFWQSVYAGSGVDCGRIFPVQTTVDGQLIRAYFNAGCLVVRPEAALLRRWQDAVLRLVASDGFRALSGRQRLFFHQVVLAGTLLAALKREEIADLPPTVNYPLHLHERVPKESWPASLRDIETCRYESVFDHNDWASRVPIHDELRSWLEAQRELARDE
jgi:hypothetical protein